MTVQDFIRMISLPPPASHDKEQVFSFFGLIWNMIWCKLKTLALHTEKKIVFALKFFVVLIIFQEQNSLIVAVIVERPNLTHWPSFLKESHSSTSQKESKLSVLDLQTKVVLTKKKKIGITSAKPNFRNLHAQDPSPWHNSYLTACHSRLRQPDVWLPAAVFFSRFQGLWRNTGERPSTKLKPTYCTKMDSRKSLAMSWQAKSWQRMYCWERAAALGLLQPKGSICNHSTAWVSKPFGPPGFIEW